MPYSDEQLARLDEFYGECLDRADTLTTGLIVRQYRHAETRETIVHGFNRRLFTLRHCLERVFEELPPQEKAPEQTILMDVTVMLQSFYINVFGAIDNLARVWVREANVTLPDGQPLPDRFIGFTSRNQTVRRSLTTVMTAYLDSSANWFSYLENYRHALAHRIPLYIPPKQLNQAEIDEYRHIDAEITSAYQDKRFGDLAGLRGKQNLLGRFEPVIMHSYGEGARPIRFHSQMLNDYATVIEFAERVVSEIDALI
jgi:hypothetical protein